LKRDGELLQFSQGGGERTGLAPREFPGGFTTGTVVGSADFEFSRPVVLSLDVEGGLERGVEGMIAELDRARVLAEVRAARFGGVMSDGRSHEIAKPWPDREFAGIKWKWRDNDVAPDGAPWGAGGRKIVDNG
jgi:hypothetical protein